MLGLSSGNPRVIREINKRLLLELIVQEGVISRSELARRSGLTRATVSQVVTDLIKENLVVEVGTDDLRQSPGRKPVLLRFNKEAGVLVGVDIGGTKVQCGVANLEGQLLLRRTWSSLLNKEKGKGTREAFLHRTAEEIKATIATLGLRPEAVRGLAVASPGIIDPTSGVVKGLSPNLPQWQDFNLKDAFQGDFPEATITAENDVNAALIGESHYGVGRGKKNAALLVISTGIGGAIMVNGDLYRGTRGAAGEIGYMLLGVENLQHDWGDRGCFESLAAGPALVAQAQEDPDLSDGDASFIFTAARQGHRGAKEIITRFAERVAVVIINLISVLDPEVIILGGGVSQSADLFLPLVKELVFRHAPVQPEIVAAGLGAEAGMYGAIALALKEVWRTGALGNSVNVGH